ncbi:MAG: RDD family protein [Dermatophilaceae bacterium]
MADKGSEPGAATSASTSAATGPTNDATWVHTDDLVTGEAVALELPPASIGSRVGSGLVDLLVGAIALLLLWAVWTAGLSRIGAGTDGALLRAVGVLVGVLVLIGIPVTSETLTRGRTLGKKLVGLRTVRDDAGPITFRHAMARGLVGVVEIYLCQGIPALICSLVTLRSKRLGDIAAGTYVIRERVAVRIPPPVAMPPELAAWAAAADLGTAPEGLQAGVRTFLAGRAELTPQARLTVGARLLSEMLPYVAPAPPAGVHAETILAALVAERRNRDHQRLVREEAIRTRLLPAAGALDPGLDASGR